MKCCKKKLDVSRQTIHAIEYGKYDPGPQLVFKTARLIEQPIDEIFDDRANDQV